MDRRGYINPRELDARLRLFEFSAGAPRFMPLTVDPRFMQKKVLGYTCKGYKIV